MSYAIKDGNGAAQTVLSQTVSGNILPESTPVDFNGNALSTAVGASSTNSAMAIQGVTGGVSVPVTVLSTQLPSVAAQGSTTAGQSGGLEMGAVAASSPSYSAGQTEPLSLTPAGALRVDASATTQPVTLAAVAGGSTVNGGVAGLLGVGGSVASGSANANNPVKIGGAFNTSQPTVTNGEVVDLQATARGALMVAIGADGFSPTIAQQPSSDALSATAVVAEGNMLFNGSTFDRQRSAPGTTGIAAVDSESTKATYSATIELSNPGTGTLLVITGSASKTVRIKKVVVVGSTTGTGGIPIYNLIRMSSAVTGGTASGITISKHDTNDAAPTALATGYTAVPTGGGTQVGTIASERIGIIATTGIGRTVFDYSTRNDKALVLRGTSDFLAVNMSAAGGATTLLHDITVVWTEE